MSNPQDEITTLRLELARERDRAEAFRHAFNVEVLKVMRVAVIQATIDADEEIARLKDRVKELEDARAVGVKSKLDEMATYGIAGHDVDKVMGNLRMDDKVTLLTLSGFAVSYREVSLGEDYLVGISQGEATIRNLEGFRCVTIVLYGPVYDIPEKRMTLKNFQILTSFPAKQEFTFRTHE